MINLIPSVRDVLVTQGFGKENTSKAWLPFYKRMGLLGHNGIDFRARRGCKLIASHSGYVKLVRSKDGGLGVEIYDYTEGFKTLDYHMLSFTVKEGQYIEQGEQIGLADNTGKNSSADHDHFHMKMIDKKGNTLNRDNGYNGAVDPTPYFPADWKLSNCLKRYGGKRKSFIRVFRSLRGLNTEQIYAFLYGGWSKEEVKRDSMRENYAYLTRSQYANGMRPFK